MSLSTAYAVVTVLTLVANAGAAVADFSGAKFVRDNAAEVDVPASWIPALATLKAAGAAGLLLGLLAVRPVGVAAAAGLTLFFVGALIAHTRTRVFHNIAYPTAYFALAAASLALVLATTE